MDIVTNPYRGQGLPDPVLTDIPAPSIDAGAVRSMLARCPHAGETPLISAQTLARSLGLGALHIKDERGRMGMGSFKALGAAYVIARDHAAGTAQGARYVTASAGNHGLSVAAGATAFGAQSVIYLAESVPTAFADRLRSHGAEVVVEGADYEASMQAAAAYAETSGAILLSDSSWPGYVDRPYRVMEGYLALIAEAVAQMPSPPTHLFLQAGVGGLAGSVAAYARHAWGDGPTIIVVEPANAPALQAAITAGRFVTATGPSSAMGRLDCKEASLIALKGLSRDADLFVTLTEDEGHTGANRAAKAGYPSTPSGAAGLSALVAGAAELGLYATSRAMIILSEGPEG